MNIRRQAVCCVFTLTMALCACARPQQPAQPSEYHTPGGKATPLSTPMPTPAPTPYVYINEQGDTIATRFIPPAGFTRTQTDAYGEFLRSQPLLPQGSPVLLYNGEQGSIQDWHAAVLAIDVGTRDLQQCADAALRLRCEYLFSIGDYEGITYHLTNGYPFAYSKWREGYRLGSDKASMEKRARADTSYESFREYLNVLFNYASTRSLAPESDTIPLDDLCIGDIFIFAGKPGHCVIVMDMCENTQGARAVLLAQSSMPAQSVHIIQPPGYPHAWMQITDIEMPVKIMYWEFGEEHIKRMP